MITEVLYTAAATAEGGRGGRVATTDGRVELGLDVPVELPGEPGLHRATSRAPTLRASRSVGSMGSPCALRLRQAVTPSTPASHHCSLSPCLRSRGRSNLKRLGDLTRLSCGSALATSTRFDARGCGGARSTLEGHRVLAHAGSVDGATAGRDDPPEAAVQVDVVAPDLAGPLMLVEVERPTVVGDLQPPVAAANRPK